MEHDRPESHHDDGITQPNDKRRRIDTLDTHSSSHGHGNGSSLSVSSPSLASTTIGVSSPSHASSSSSSSSHASSSPSLPALDDGGHDVPLPPSLLADDEFVDPLPLTSSITGGSQSDLYTTNSVPSSAAAAAAAAVPSTHSSYDYSNTASSSSSYNPWAASSSSSSSSSGRSRSGVTRREVIDIDDNELPLPASIADDDDEVVVLGSSSTHHGHGHHGSSNGNGNGHDDMPLPESIAGDDDTIHVETDNDNGHNHEMMTAATQGYGYPGMPRSSTNAMVTSRAGYGYPMAAYPMTTSTHMYAPNGVSYPPGYTMEQYQQLHRQQLLAMRQQARAAGGTVDLVDNSDEDENTDNRYGTVIASIVGIQYCTEKPVADEILELSRLRTEEEPHSFRAFNRAGKHVGFLDPRTARALSIPVDQHWIKLEVQCTRVEATKATVRIHVSGIEALRPTVEPYLRQLGGTEEYISIKAPELTPGYVATPGGPSVQDIENDLDKLFNSELDFNLLPEREPHRSILTPLKSYQKQGLEWMMRAEGRRTMEGGDSPGFFFWEKKIDPKDGSTSYYNFATNTSSSTAPEQARGGILADEMGLGKTLQLISLCASTSTKSMPPPPPPPAPSSFSSFSSYGPTSAGSSTAPLLPKENYVPPTLIVSPLSVVSNWQHQIDTHVAPGHLKVYTYHGAQRERDIKKLKGYDVIITTYNILAQEFNPDNEGEEEDEEVEEKKPKKSLLMGGGGSIPKKKAKKETKKAGSESPLFGIYFFRIILDEAHIIRDRNTRQSRAACALQAERRWAVTGTPFQNKIGDAFALLNFLKVQPFTSIKYWNHIIIKPLRNREPKGLERLQKVLGVICLRRRKNERIHGKPILELPSKTRHQDSVREVELKGHERKLYETLENHCKSQFKSLLNKGDEGDAVLSNYAFVLEMLLRMRQACDHPKLVPEKYHKRGFAESVEEKIANHRQSLLLLLEEYLDECPRCQRQAQDMDDPIITMCAHVFCRECVTSVVTADPMHACPVCQQPVDLKDLISRDTKIGRGVKKEEIEPEIDIRDMHTIMESSKLKALLDQLRAFHMSDPTTKAVVFSQWTSFLNIIQAAFKREGITFVRLDGGMTNDNRRKAIQSFRDNASIRVFLISLKAGGLGLNLTAANKVFLMDPWWNPATEDQAVDRIHRLGQKRAVEIIRYIAKGTVESKIIELQNQKREMISTALSKFGKSKKELKEDRLRDLKFLFK